MARKALPFWMPDFVDQCRRNTDTLQTCFFPAHKTVGWQEGPRHSVCIWIEELVPAHAIFPGILRRFLADPIHRNPRGGARARQRMAEGNRNRHAGEWAAARVVSGQAGWEIGGKGLSPGDQPPSFTNGAGPLCTCIAVPGSGAGKRPQEEDAKQLT